MLTLNAGVPAKLALASDSSGAQPRAPQSSSGGRRNLGFSGFEPLQGGTVSPPKRHAGPLVLRS